MKQFVHASAAKKVGTYIICIYNWDVHIAVIVPMFYILFSFWDLKIALDYRYKPLALFSPKRHTDAQGQKYSRIISSRFIVLTQ